MAATSAALPTLTEQRLELLLSRARQLQIEGLTYPSGEIEAAVRAAVDLHDMEKAEVALRRGELLMERIQRDWSWLKGLLERAEELRQLARTAGVDLEHLDARVGNPGELLKGAPITEGALEKAAASASLSLAVLNDVLPKFLVQNAKSLGGSLRDAFNRGEETDLPKERFTRLLRSLNEGDLKSATQRFLEFRTAVAQIPRAPAFAAMPADEAEEILLEAKNLARRLNRMKSRARNARSAAQLAAQVRAALSEERRYGTPEEEIEELWNEVDRLTQERGRAQPEPALQDSPWTEPTESDDLRAAFREPAAYLDTDPPPPVLFDSVDLTPEGSTRRSRPPPKPMRTSRP
jgi:hypothetical protein